ncbi:hypothetical protein LO762_12690 [Actinocorallia sp. API 0066]|uniref:hypothetical protein n=1 Tax=Actinocorallia sp. API 0066 TaxID=2896846 RepID=UPI001E2B1386|nr:hypothetical protein [Actinocorallia sp. API 0066]MCD0450043.1 hypothetical protein [Actinocorallia sp. API 0066]
MGVFAEELKPAGGAALDQVFIASGAGVVLAAVLLVLGWGHRSGRLDALSRIAAYVTRGASQGLPGWAALPSLVSLASLLTALLGMYWDISLHITRGRDEGPLANIAHYPILIGLFGIFAAGVIALVLPLREKPGPDPVRITRNWYVPVGGALVAGAGFYALLGFPLDDVWHRIFGQDVTLWGPTHLMLIGGAGLSLVGMMVLEREGRVAGEPGPAFLSWLRRGSMAGGLLVGLSVFQAEFDFGVPQFRLVNQPFLIALAAGCALVVARLWVGRGGALMAAAFYLVVRGGVSLLVGPVIGELTPAVPMYLAEALLVELVALALIRRPYLFAAVSGLAIGTAGFAAQYVWTGFAYRLPWTTDLVPEGVVMATAGGLAGAVLGVLLAEGLAGRLPQPAVTNTLFAGALVVIAGCVANGLIATVPQDVTARVQIAQDGNATITLNRPLDDPAWVQVTGWQGGDLHVDLLERTGPETYRTTSPLPLDGTWKTLVRLHDGRDLSAVPIFLPEDPAIGAPELAAVPDATRPAQSEKLILQRELKTDVPGWVWGAASLVVLVCSLVLVVSLGWGTRRIARATAGRPEVSSRS